VRVFCRERLLQEENREVGERVSAGGELKRNHVSSARGLKEATTLSSAGGLRRARCHLQGAGWFPCRAADVKHLSAGSLPGTPVGRAVVLMVIIIR